MAVIHDGSPNELWLDSMGGGVSPPCVFTHPLSARLHISVSVRKWEKKLLTTQNFCVTRGLAQLAGQG